MTASENSGGEDAFVVPPDLRDATVAIVTSAGLHAPGEGDWTPFDQSFRVIPGDRRDMRMGHVSAMFDRSGFASDVNVVYPIDRLAELDEDGVIGRVAPRHISFMGAQDDTMTTLRMDTGPAAAKVLRDDGVDVVLLTPVCPICTRTVSALARVLEAEGIATVSLSLVRELAEAVQPPRALHCNFPLGRPLGRPSDAEFQHRVLLSAFDLLERPSGPVLEDFPEAVEGGDDHPIACRIPPRDHTSLDPAVDEALGLRSAYERQRTRSGSTSVGAAVDADGIPEAIAALRRIADGVPLAEAALPSSTPNLALDVRVYYEEAALALIDHVPAARSTTTWFFEQTEAGKVVSAARDVLKDARMPLSTWFAMFPEPTGSLARYLKEYEL